MQKTEYFTCSLHSNNIAKFIIVDPNEAYLFKCSECLIESAYDNNQLILLKQIIENKQEQYITNWPPKVKKDILKKCKNIIGQQNQQQLIQEIDNHFDGFEQEIIKILQTSRKRIILTLTDSLSKIEEETKKEYAQISKIDQLQSIISDQNSMMSNLKIFFNDMISQSQQNEEILKKQHVKYQQRVDSLQLNCLSAIKYTTIQFVESINKLNDNNLIKENENNQMKENEINQMNEKNQENNSNSQPDEQKSEKKEIAVENELDFQTIAKIPLNIISHIIQVQNDIKAQKQDVTLNLEDLYKQLKNNYNNVYNNISIDPNFIQDTQNKYEKIYAARQTLWDQQSNLIEQQNKKLSKIQNILQKLLSFDIQYLDQVCNLFEQKQNYDQKDSNNNYINLKLCEDPEFKNILNQEILNYFPIFDIGVKNKIKPINFAIIKHDSNKKDQSQMIFKQKNYAQQIDSQYNKTNLKLDYILDVNKKYIIRFRFNVPFQNIRRIVVGLFKQNSEHLHCILSNPDIGDLNTCKGGYLRSTSSELKGIQSIEMRVCMKKQTVTYADFPYYENVNITKDKQNLSDESKKWSIGLNLELDPNRIIEITEFLELDDFSELY